MDNSDWSVSQKKVEIGTHRNVIKVSKIAFIVNEDKRREQKTLW